MDTAVREVLVANIADAFAAESARYREAGARSLWCIVNLLPPATFAVGGSMVTLEQVRQMTNS